MSDAVFAQILGLISGIGMFVIGLKLNQAGEWVIINNKVDYAFSIFLMVAGPTLSTVATIMLLNS